MFTASENIMLMLYIGPVMEYTILQLYILDSEKGEGWNALLFNAVRNNAVNKFKASAVCQQK